MVKKLGFIGTGSMGSLLIEAFIKAGAPEDHFHVTNRSLHKAKALQEKYRGIHIHQDALSIAKEAEWLFICTKPLEMVTVLDKLSAHIKPGQVIITITSPLQVEETELLVNNQEIPVARFIPSIVNLSLTGPSLITFSERCTEGMRNDLRDLFSTISTPVLIDPSVTRVASDIASCGPAFISFLVERMIKGAVEERNIDEKTATAIAESMLIGYGELMKQKYFDLSSLQKRVTVPGGVTGVGLKVLNNETGDMFHKLFRETEKKYQEDRKGIQKKMRR